MTMRASNLVLFYGLFILATLVQASLDHQTEKDDDVVVPVLASAVGLLGALVIAAAVFWILKSRREITEQSRLVPVEVGRRHFSYPEVVKMTDNFRRVIGGGGFGTVYHGYLDDAPVAVKIYREDHQGFQTETDHLARVHHKNLINLVGYCNEATKLALVFEFMANGDLKKHLTDSTASSASIVEKLTWERRLRIAIDVAKGLDYLHDGCEPPIIHRDVNSLNILLSENLEAKFSGFALAVTLPVDDDASHVSAVIAGTLGYLDPEYYVTGRVTKKSDVYGFGVVLMEIITGKPALQRGEEGLYGLLVQWVSSMLANGEGRSIVDPRLEGEFDIYSAEEALKIAVASVSENSGDRPAMGEVVVKLKHCLQMERARLNESVSFNSITSIEIM